MIPEGLLVTVPDPVPDFVTVKLYTGIKCARTAVAAVMVTVQTPVPEHAPDQPEKVDPLVAKAVKVTDVPNA